MKKKLIGAIDQGTTSTRFLIFDIEGNIVCSAQKEHKQIYPNPGWVEHDAQEIYLNTVEVIKECLDKLGEKKDNLVTIGITNQRETTIIWNKKTGKPYYNAIVWQDTRTKDICVDLEKNIGNKKINEVTGLLVSTYFSGTKIKWILDNVKGVREDIKKGEVCFGTIDSFLIFKLTGNHYTEVSNISRTLLYNIKSLKFEKSILDQLEIPESILPKVLSSVDDFGEIDVDLGLKQKITINAVLGDQQAALFGQACFDKGDLKNTYGTGCFLLLNTGEEPFFSKNGLLTTIAYKIKNEKVIYALEGSVANAGSVVQWFRDNLKVINDSKEIEKLAEKVEDNGGVYFVPAFNGLFAPYWDEEARGMIMGLTRYANISHIARSAIESTVFQVNDIKKAMEKDSDIKIDKMKVDGGMVKNNLLMNFQSGISDVELIIPEINETTVLGAALAAGLGKGIYDNLSDIKKIWKEKKKINTDMDSKNKELLLNGWEKAIKKVMS